jgi:methyl-accepting chemotaxis protein
MLNSTILTPGTAILNRLSFTGKFALIFILFLIPITYLSYSSYIDHQVEINQVDKEEIGLKYIAAVRPLFEHMAQTRGMTNAYLNGNTSFKNKIENKRQTVKQELVALLAIESKLNHILHMDDSAQRIQQNWSKLMEDAFSMPAQQAFKAHTKIIEQVLELLNQVLAQSSLFLDARVDSNLLIKSIGTLMPTLAENMGKTRGLGAGVAAKGEFSPDTFIKLTRFVETINNAKNELDNAFRKALNENPELSEQLTSKFSNAINLVNAFTKITHNKLIKTDAINIDSKIYFETGTKAISSILTLYDASLPALDSLLLERSKELTNHITYSLLTNAIFLIAALYLFAAFYNSIMSSISTLKSAASEISNGDLTITVDIASHDEMQTVANHMNEMIEKNNALVSQVISAANQVVTSANNSATTSHQTQKGISEQNMQIDMVATAMNEMTATVAEVARNAESAAEATQNARTEATNGHQIVNSTISSINKLSNEVSSATSVIKKLEADSDNIESVLDVIRGIAEQTNLLALNAAIEAARAGEQGRGFAVVADEVRTLASRTQASTEEIQQMIQVLQEGTRNAVSAMEKGNEQTQESVSQAAEAGKALEAITSAVEHISLMNAQIASAAEEQSSVAEEINRNIVNVSNISNETADGANQTAESSEALRSVANQLHNLVGEFKVD